MTVAQLLSILKDGGVLGLLVVVLMGGAKGWWVWGWQYREICQERDEWRQIALTGTNAAERLAQLTE